MQSLPFKTDIPLFQKFVVGKFSWQEGYGAFSYSKSQIPAIASYIENQELHHKKKTFIEEYRKIHQDLARLISNAEPFGVHKLYELILRSRKYKVFLKQVHQYFLYRG